MSEAANHASRAASNVSAIVLAGGRGTRLQAVVADRPKPLALVAGRPFVTYLLDQLVDAGICNAVLSTGYLAEQFETEIGPKYHDLSIAYSQETEPLGTGGAIRFAADEAGLPREVEHVLVMNGDSYCAANLEAYIEWHIASGHDVSLLLARVEDASRYGTVMSGADGHITAFLEKQPEQVAGNINAGIYLFRREMLGQFPPGPSSIERDLFPVWIQQWQVKGWVTDAQFIDIGIPSDYERSQHFMREVKR